MRPRTEAFQILQQLPCERLRVPAMIVVDPATHHKFFIGKNLRFIQWLTSTREPPRLTVVQEPTGVSGLQCFQSLCYHKEVARPNIVHQGYQFVRHTVPAVIRPIRTLWHEIIGFFFLVLAAWAIPSGVRTVRELDSGKGSLVRLIFIVLFVTIMAGYGISSFRRARKISRS